jgi:hypothetical protein
MNEGSQPRRIGTEDFRKPDPVPSLVACPRRGAGGSGAKAGRLCACEGVWGRKGLSGQLEKEEGVSSGLGVLPKTNCRALNQCRNRYQEY